MTECAEQPSDVDDLLAIKKCASRFRLGRRGDDVLDEFANNVKRGVVESAEEIGEKVVAGDTTLGAGCDEVGGVGVDVEDHVGREKTDGGGRVSRAVIHQHCHLILRELRWFRLRLRDVGEGGEHCVIESSGVIEDGARFLLNNVGDGV